MELDADSQITHGARIPPYRQLAAILKARIERGDWDPRVAIASETRLVQEYGLARSTVRRTVKLLVAEGVLEVVPRVGTFIARPEEPGQ